MYIGKLIEKSLNIAVINGLHNHFLERRCEKHMKGYKFDDFTIGAMMGFLMVGLIGYVIFM